MRWDNQICLEQAVFNNQCSARNREVHKTLIYRAQFQEFLFANREYRSKLDFTILIFEKRPVPVAARSKA